MKKFIIILTLIITSGIFQNVSLAAAEREFLGYSYTVQNNDVYLFLGVYDNNTNPMTLLKEYKIENLMYGDVVKFNFYCSHYFGMSEFQGTKQKTTPKGIASEFVSGCERTEFVEIVSVTNRWGTVQEVQGTKIIRDDTKPPDPNNPEPTDPEPTDPEPTDPEPTDPEPTDPEPTDPEPTDPEPTCTLKCLFESEEWLNLLNKLNQILNAIPPEPNWNNVAAIFTNSIVPTLMNEVKNYVGYVGETPPTPPDLAQLNDHDIMDRLPEFQEVPNLEQAGFTANDIKQQAPIIKENPDNSGGFDLTKNPLETLPEVPKTIIPNQTENKNWMNTPNEPTNNFPTAPKQTNDNEIDLTKPPIPSENNSNENIPPTPDGTTNTNTNLLDYKPNPESENGSGKEIK